MLFDSRTDSAIPFALLSSFVLVDIAQNSLLPMWQIFAGSASVHYDGILCSISLLCEVLMTLDVTYFVPLHLRVYFETREDLIENVEKCESVDVKAE